MISFHCMFCRHISNYSPNWLFKPCRLPCSYARLLGHMECILPWHECHWITLSIPQRQVQWQAKKPMRLIPITISQPVWIIGRKTRRQTSLDIDRANQISQIWHKNRWPRHYEMSDVLAACASFSTIHTILLIFIYTSSTSRNTNRRHGLLFWRHLTRKWLLACWVLFVSKEGWTIFCSLLLHWAVSEQQEL